MHCDYVVRILFKFYRYSSVLDYVYVCALLSNLRIVDLTVPSDPYCLICVWPSGEKKLCCCCCCGCCCWCRSWLLSEAERPWRCWSEDEGEVRPPMDASEDDEAAADGGDEPF